jgi:hypothetical protein
MSPDILKQFGSWLSAQPFARDSLLQVVQPVPNLLQTLKLAFW